MAACEFQRAQEKGLQTLGGRGWEVRSRKKYERGCLGIKVGGMRSDLGFSLCLLSTGIKGIMKLVLIFQGWVSGMGWEAGSVDIGAPSVLGLQTDSCLRGSLTPARGGVILILSTQLILTPAQGSVESRRGSWKALLLFSALWITSRISHIDSITLTVTYSANYFVPDKEPSFFSFFFPSHLPICTACVWTDEGRNVC